MALISRRAFATLVGSALSACTYHLTPASKTARQAQAGQHFARRPGAPKVLVLMPDLPQTREVWNGLAAELSVELDVALRLVDASASARALASVIEGEKPQVLVLMNNPTVRAYRAYQQSKGSGARFPPAVIVMASFLEEQLAGLGNATGISYELPSVIVLANLRALLARSIVRVGVVYRPSFADFVWRQQKLAMREEIALIGVPVREEPEAADVRRAIFALEKDYDVDAIWVLNDNALLAPALLRKAWLPSLGAMKPLPAVVGVPSLVSSQQHFGTFAMMPDHTALGMQAAALVFDVIDGGYSAVGLTHQLPVSIETSVDARQVEEHFALKPGALERIDHIVK
jgi:ABC-type uncharacterized transport system substrate-binding protein